MNFLQLVQRAASDSGIIPGSGRPVSIAGATGIEARFVGWVASAWTDIQNSEANWLFLRDEFTHALTIGVQRYTAASLGITRFRSWQTLSDDGNTVLFTLYDPDIGVADEGELWVEPYAQALRYARGTIETAKPGMVAVDDQKRLFFHQVPNKAYVLNGTVNKSGQVLTLPTDTPECPEEFHMVIVYKALVMAAVFDEGMVQVPYWLSEYKRILFDLQRNQTPELQVDGPLA